MNALLDDAEARGWPLASLRASESVIYRRYGFGVAGEFADVTIESDRAKPVAGSTSGTMRLLAPDEIEDITRLVDGRALTRRPGLITRPDTWRAWHFQAAIERSKGALVALHSDSAGQPDGYTCYETEWGDVFGPGGTGKVLDVVALSDEVELDLWRYLFDVDLIQRWTAPGRPLDDLIREAVADRRAYATTAINDEQWLRLIDVDRALGARSFNPVAGSVVVEVRDPYFAANRGRWRIDGDGARSIDDPADLVASIDALSALYLGGMSWRTEAAVGRVEAGPGLDGVRHFDEMLTLSDLLFSVRPLPFCGTFF
jgi:predicted acetyltransferase